MDYRAIAQDNVYNQDEPRAPPRRRGDRGRSVALFLRDRFLPWIVGDLIPFGDLVTDIWLWMTLASTKPDSYACSSSMYEYMRKLLAVGTVISALPQSAILLGVLVGLTGIVVGGLAFVAHRRDGHHIVGIAKDLARYTRYAFSDAKATADFLVHRTRFGSRNSPPMGWEHTVEFVVTTTMMIAHLPLLLVVYVIGCSVNVPPERIFIVFIVLQVIAGTMTTVASLFFAYAGGEDAAFVSAAFGLYSLLVGTVIAAKKSGPPPAGESTPLVAQAVPVTA